MKLRSILPAILFITILHNGKGYAQDSDFIFKARIAVFAPLYLDSAFEASGNYKPGNTFPRYINPGLDFYEGVQLALDSLAGEKIPLEVFVFDTRAAGKTLKQQLEEAALDSVQLIIGYVATTGELQQIAYSAQEMKVPFVNVNLPNDGGVYENPYLVLLNATLKTHVEAIYRYLQKYYPLDDLVVFRKKGQLENMIYSYFEEAGKTTPGVPLKLKFVELTDSFSVDQISARLDSNHHSVCISGSLDENFTKRLAQQLALLSNQYPLTLIGMPTFENFAPVLTGREYKDLESVYSTSYYNDRTDTVTKKIISWYNTKFFSQPSDLLMKGYEATWHFVNLLLKYKTDFASNISNKEFNIFRELNIQPVLNKKTMSLDYFENKKIFFIRMQSGVVKEVN